MTTENQIMRELAEQAATLADDDLRKALSTAEGNLRTARVREQESAIWHFECLLAALRYEASHRGGYLR